MANTSGDFGNETAGYVGAVADAAADDAADESAAAAEFEAGVKDHAAEGKDREPKESIPERQRTAPATQNQPSWDNLPEEYRPAVDALLGAVQRTQQSFRSEQGRAVAHQKRVRELEEALRKAQEEPRPPTQAETARQEPSISVDNDLADIFPEVARGLADVREENARLRQELDDRLQPVEQTAMKSAVAEQEQILHAQFPQWDQVAETPAFAAALADAPPLIRQAAERNGELIVDASEAAAVMEWYMGHYARHNPPAPAAPGNGATQPNQSTPASAAAIRQAREHKLAAAVSPNVKGEVPDLTDAEDSFEAGIRDWERERARADSWS